MVKKNLAPLTETWKRLGTFPHFVATGRLHTSTALLLITSGANDAESCVGRIIRLGKVRKFVKDLCLRRKLVSIFELARRHPDCNPVSWDQDEGTDNMLC
jgi:hypothetical protein